MQIENDADWADEAVLIEGYRTGEIEFEIGQGNHSIFLDGELHSTLSEGETVVSTLAGKFLRMDTFYIVACCPLVSSSFKSQEWI